MSLFVLIWVRHKVHRVGIAYAYKNRDAVYIRFLSRHVYCIYDYVFLEYACNDSGWFWADGKQKIIKEDCSECNQDYAPYVMSLPATIMSSVRKASCNRAIENGKCEFDCTTEMCKNVNRIEG